MSNRTPVAILEDLAYAQAFHNSPTHTVTLNGKLATTIWFLASWEQKTVAAPSALLELVGLDNTHGTYGDVARSLLDEYARQFPVRRYEVETARKHAEFERKRREHEQLMADYAKEKAAKAKPIEEVDPFADNEATVVKPKRKRA